MIEKKGGNFVLYSILTLFILMGAAAYADAAFEGDIRLVVDGKDITELSAPIIENDRTLVPLRFVSEEIGADVSWDGEKRMVEVEKGERSVRLWIGSHLIDYNKGENYDLSDVAAKIIDDRTYVPLRLVGNALGTEIKWDGENRIVYVDSKKTSEISSFFDIDIELPQNGETIVGETTVKISAPDSFLVKANEIRLMLLDKETAKGFVVAKEVGTVTRLTYMPRVEDFGEKVLALAIYDENKKFIGGDSILVNIDVEPRPILSGLENGDIVKDTITLTQRSNFIPEYVEYEFTRLIDGYVTSSGMKDPWGRYSWTPSSNQNGEYTVKAVAYDGKGIAYKSEGVNVYLNLEKKIFLSGLTEGMTVDKALTLYADRNFDVTETQYIIRDVYTGEESILASIPYGGYRWFPAPEESGDKEVSVRVADTAGRIYQSDFVKVKVAGEAKIVLKGIGPNQVLTGEASLSIESNVELSGISYILLDSSTGVKKVLARDRGYETFVYKPNLEDSGNKSIYAQGNYGGKTIRSESIPLKIYLGKLYTSQAITDKDNFLDFASNMAIESYETTGMSAALQTAQAILETGWGQSVPVDKYSGKLSNNLFGIKGSATNGSVVSNTWEVYNGVSFRTDAEFRAYNNVNEAWNDHKSLLLNKSRYEQFREVMHDSTLGAWAVRRAGYATDPDYSMKLINIIKRYDLQKLDEIGI